MTTPSTEETKVDRRDVADKPKADNPTAGASTATEQPKADPLDELAEKIKAEHQAIVAAMQGKGLLLRAIKIGQDLIDAKAKLDHGQWLPWLKDKCDLKERSAQRYMRLAEGRKKIEAEAKAKSVTLSDFTLNAAAKVVKPPLEQQQQSSNEQQEQSTKTSDGIDKLVDKLISKLKEMRKEKPDNALAAAADLVRQLKLVDLYVEPPTMKKAA
jgi:hypothetical protein